MPGVDLSRRRTGCAASPLSSCRWSHHSRRELRFSAAIGPAWDVMCEIGPSSGMSVSGLVSRTSSSRRRETRSRLVLIDVAEGEPRRIC